MSRWSAYGLTIYVPTRLEGSEGQEKYEIRTTKGVYVGEATRWFDVPFVGEQAWDIAGPADLAESVPTLYYGPKAWKAILKGVRRAIEETRKGQS